MTIETRPAWPSDVEAIARFDEFNGDRLREIEAGTCFVALSDGRVVAYASYEPRGLLGQPLLTYLCVCADSKTGPRDPAGQAGAIQSRRSQAAVFDRRLVRRHAAHI
ncbi:hypothetical protein [Rubrivivax gelatinosus]|uniref:hypothetical protein n=1 Tax=Rubrivivax gelatinosus TaxID=28068 RepID=UPI0019071401|nr:hypothetical protein [Rubrivivax gelatinosus]